MKLSNLQQKIKFVLHVCMLLLLVNYIVALWREVSGFVFDQLEGDPLMRSLLLAGYFLTIPIILFHLKGVFSIVVRSSLLWLLILWAAVSILWSGAPDVSIRRVIAVLLTTLYALVLYLRYPFKSFLHLLGVVFFIAILSSLLMVAIKPEWGLMSSIHEGAWRGVFIHKNTLGKVSVFALCVFATLWSFGRNPRERIFWAGALVLGVVTLIGSESATALVVAGTMALGALLLRLARPWRKVWPVFLLMILVIGSGVALLIIQNSETFLDALGRDVSLTGRIPLWQILIPMGLKHPWGYGYGAFWLGWNGPSAEIWIVKNWMPTIAHNGYIDLWLQLGWVGLGLGIILLVKMFMFYLRPALFGSKRALFWVLFGITFITYNLVEVNFFCQNNIYWVIMAYALLSAHLE